MEHGQLDFNLVPTQFKESIFPPIPSETIFLNLRAQELIHSKESIPPAYVAWRSSTTTLFLLGS
jgi:hypothetical protein